MVQIDQFQRDLAGLVLQIVFAADVETAARLIGQAQVANEFLELRLIPAQEAVECEVRRQRRFGQLAFRVADDQVRDLKVAAHACLALRREARRRAGGDGNGLQCLVTRRGREERPQRILVHVGQSNGGLPERRAQIEISSRLKRACRLAALPKLARKLADREVVVF